MTDWNEIFEETAARIRAENDATEASPRYQAKRKADAEALERQFAREIADGIRRADGSLIEDDEDEDEEEGE
jgi:hypothetical protein